MTALVGLVGLCGAVVAAALAFVLSSGENSPLECGGLVLATFVVGRLVSRGRSHAARLLPLIRRLHRLTGPVIAIGLILVLRAVDALPGLSDGQVALIAVVGATATLVAERLAERLAAAGPVRVAVIGSGRMAESLDRELRVSGTDAYEIVGWVHPVDEPVSDRTEIPALGAVSALEHIVADHGIDLLLLSGSTSRLAVFDEVARSCLHLPVRLRELSGFYEEVFGHVPVAEINTAWFQCIMHPNYRPEQSLSERALDIAVATVTLVVCLPLLAVLAVIIRVDGGPLLFRQQRIGEGGHPFTILKLRTMRVGADQSSWSSEEDPRVTSIGRFLRRTHLDELPQVLNVLRGDMSIVGPRPEQPSFVDRLEHVVPFYQRRHLIKPGVTGWAQVRCGYAGSELGSAWKVCHDLFYLRHRSVWLNVMILVETMRTLIADPQYTAKPSSVDFILRPALSVVSATTESPASGLSATSARS